jgi:hypothetical protein
LLKYIPIILICHADIPETECKAERKGVTVTIGEHQNSPMACLFEGQSRAARLAFSPELGDPSYVKIKCVPKLFLD